MANCHNSIMERVSKIWKAAAKAADNTACADIYNQSVKDFRKLWPVGAALSCKQLEKGFETAATTHGRIQQCVKQSKQVKQSQESEPFIDITSGAKKAKGRVMMSEYLCDDLSLPMVITKHKNVAAAKREAAKDKRYCYRIHTIEEF